MSTDNGNHGTQIADMNTNVARPRTGTTGIGERSENFAGGTG
jgi:hypothetical protein